MNLKKIVLNTFFIFSLELILHIAIFSNISIQIVYILLFSIVIGSIITIVSNTSKNNKLNKFINISINLLVMLIFIAQFIHYKFYHSIFSFYSLVNGGQVVNFMGIIIKVFLNNIFVVILLILAFIAFIILNKYIKQVVLTKKQMLIQFIGTILLFILTVFSLNIDKKDTYSTYKLYHNIHAPTFMCQKLGLLTTMRIDLQRIMFNFKENNGFNSNTENKEEIADKKIEYNTVNIDFDNLISNEKNENIKDLHEYFKATTATNKNKYTGIFKDKNLIVITAEAFSPIAIDKDLTPTLYKLYNESIHFNNFYTPIYYVSTSDGEYMSLTSLLPKEGVWSFQESSKISLPYVYGNIFKKYGYTTRAYHNGTHTYYKRNKSHPNMGYKFMACGNGLEKKINCRIWPQSDLEMINATFDDYKNDKKFVAYYMTISGHLNYNFYGNTMALRNKKAVNNLNYSEAIKAYMATHIELDKALNSLINKLKKEKKLDATVIVLNADHYPYGLSVDEMKEKADYIQDEKFDIHKNNLIIWNSNLDEEIKTDKYASNLDILPTVLNLFGIEYDSRLLIGKDILSDSDGIVIFNDRSWISEYGKYNALEKKFTAFKNINNEEEYINNINNLVYNKFSVSRSILENNYYKYLNLD